MIPLFSIMTASSEVINLLGANPTRFYPFSMAPQDCPKPYCVWQVVNGQPFNTLSCPAAADHYTVQIDIYAKTVEETHTVAKSLRYVLEVDKRAVITNWGREDYENDTKLYRFSFDFDFIEQRG